MRTLRHRTWIFHDSMKCHDLVTILSENYSLQSKYLRTFTRYWYDTFDWLLFREKKLLKREGNKWMLVDAAGISLHTEISKKVHRSYHSFVQDSLREVLQKTIDIRALIEYGIEEVRASEIRILNKERKTVARFIIEESICTHSGAQLLHITLFELRGYAKQFKGVGETLSQLGSPAEDTQATLFRAAASGTGRVPLDYHSGYDVPLDPSMSSAEAVIAIYRSLLEDMHWNKQGVVDDIDTEFLHDLRVAVRRTRSGLTLMKNILDRERSEYFKQEFKQIGTKTGPVRDLDVYLLSEEKYRDRLPQELQEGLDYFFDELAQRREIEQKKLVRFLKSSSYRNILEEWQELLSDVDKHFIGKKCHQPIVDLANTIITKRLQRILNDGGLITGESPDEDLHRLRIQCKKLRYGLEFFASLYDLSTMKKLIGRLKKLQNNLGDFNDLSVQQEMLAEYLNTLTPRSKKSRATAASIGGLMADLAREHTQVRLEFESKFAAFTAEKNIQLYQTLFVSSSKEKT